MAVTFYDKLGINENIQLDLSMLEAQGLITHDESKNHIKATLHSSMGSITWQALATGHYGLYMNPTPAIPTHRYLDAPAADTTALDFTSNDYGLACWLRWTTSATSEVLMGKYMVNVRGWEVYLTDVAGSYYMTVRHHHSAGATTRTASYSLGWTPGTWCLFGCDRLGTAHQHYRNGQPVTTVSDVLIDPESSAASDLVIGSRYSLDQNWYYGELHRPRAASVPFGAIGHRYMFETERDWYGL